ncbi:MAG TPA: lytic transglycosylase domain-containing protein [Oscillatoriaceae cyanobacterium]
MSLTLSGCFPRLAHYDDYQPPSPHAPIPQLPDQGTMPSDRIAAFIVMSNPMLSTDTVQQEAQAIARYSAESGVPTNLLVSLIAVESSFNPRAVSPVGAQGLGQLMPETAHDLGVNDPFDVDQNIRGTAHYIAWLGRAWANNPDRWELVLASYLAGVGTVQKQVQSGQALTQEQSAYAHKILSLATKV